MELQPLPHSEVSSERQPQSLCLETAKVQVSFVDLFWYVQGAVRAM